MRRLGLASKLRLASSSASRQKPPFAGATLAGRGMQNQSRNPPAACPDRKVRHQPPAGGLSQPPTIRMAAATLAANILQAGGRSRSFVTTVFLPSHTETQWRYSRTTACCGHDQSTARKRAMRTTRRPATHARPA